MSTIPEDGSKKAIPPYLSHKTFTNFLEGLRNGIPGRIDRSVMPNLSGTAQAHLMYSLRYLDLINADGVPTDQLTQLVIAQGAERQRILKELLINAYDFVFKSGIDLEKATSKQVEELFASTGGTGETLRKTLSFFMAAAKDAGIKLSPFMKRTRKGRGAGQRGRGVSAKGGTSGTTSEVPAPLHPTPPQDAAIGSQKTIELRRGGSLSLSISVNLWELKGEDRTFVFDLIDKIDAYEEGSKGSAAETDKVEKGAGE